MSLTRKQLLAGGVALAGAVAAPAVAEPAGAFVRALPSEDAIWDWEKRLAGFCPTFTGSAGHNAFVDMLAEGFKAAGLKPERKTFRFPYWRPIAWGLSLNGEAIPVAGYRPHSGPTGAGGVTAPMAYVGAGGGVAVPGAAAAGGMATIDAGLDLKAAAGKIALIDVPPRSSGLAGAVLIVGISPASDAPPAEQRSATVTGMGAPSVDGVARAGGLGAVYIWNGFSDAEVQDLMQPFFGPPTAAPTLWVGEATGRRLKAEAAKGSRLTLTLQAEVRPDTPSDSIWAVLPGQTDDVVIVNSHTDGCNACEENGGIGVLALAHALARLPVEQRRRTYVFLGTTGHFSHGFIRGAPDWQKDHPELMARAVACMTIEHLGAVDYRGDRSTGQFVWGVAYAPTRPLGEVFLRAAAIEGAPRMAVAQPQGRYPGEGYPFAAAGLPTLSYLAVPDYLTAAPPKDGDIGRLSRTRMMSELRVFARCLQAIDAMSPAEIKG